MTTLLEHLCANHCEFNEFIQSMILLNVLPQKWDHIASVYIQETEVNDFNLVRIREQIIGEWECSNAGKASVRGHSYQPTSAMEYLHPTTPDTFCPCNALYVPPHHQ